MSKLLMIILNDIHILPELLEVWREIGVPGTTILKSAGGHRTRNWLGRVGLGDRKTYYRIDLHNSIG
jgi:hypothetical protein